MQNTACTWNFFFPPYWNSTSGRGKNDGWVFLFVCFVVVFKVLLTVHDGQQLQNICIPVAYSNHFPTCCIKNGRFQPWMVLPLHLRTDKDRKLLHYDLHRDLLSMPMKYISNYLLCFLLIFPPTETQQPFPQRRFHNC